MSTKLKANIEKLLKDHRYLTDNLTEGVWVLDAESLKFDYATPSLQELSGYTEEEYRGMPIRKRMPPETYRKILSALIEERRKREKGGSGVKTLELEMLHKDGSSYWIETTAKFITDDGGRLKVIGVVREISARKRVEEDRERLIRQLKEAVAEKDRLLAEVKILRGLLPICSGCRRIRDEEGRWWPMDAYVKARTEAELTHTICEDCRDVFYD